MRILQPFAKSLIEALTAGDRGLPTGACLLNREEEWETAESLSFGIVQALSIIDYNVVGSRKVYMTPCGRGGAG